MEARPNPKRVAAGRENRKKRRGLTPDGRQRIRESTLANQPWQHSTGPKTMQGKARSARNGKVRQQGAMSIRELHQATAEVDFQIKDIRALLQDAKAANRTSKPVAVGALSPLVEKALQLLTEQINLETGLSHPGDRSKAKELLTRLHDAGVSLNVTSITVWAREHGWLDADARDLAELAAKIESGQAVRVKDGPWWPDDILEEI
jgi:hypothetical protein